MEHIKTKKHVLKKAGGILLLMAVILAGSTWERRTAGDRQPQFYAWWGTIYPEFCIEKAEDNGENKPVKISFWLAQALDWCYNISTDQSRSINYFRRQDQ